jgi:hypothetical protein
LSVGDIGHIPPNLQSWGTAADGQLIDTVDAVYSTIYDQL